MILTALCSATCAVLEWCRHARGRHHHSPAGKSYPDALINHPELL
jgi:hypothetical protein